MPKHLVLVSSLVSAVVILVMLCFTTPTDVGPLGVLVFFGAIYILAFGFCLALAKFFVRIVGKKATRKTYLSAAVVAFGPIILLLTQSMGSVSPLTVGLTVVFVFLGCFLIRKWG